MALTASKQSQKLREQTPTGRKVFEVIPAPPNSPAGFVSISKSLAENLGKPMAHNILMGTLNALKKDGIIQELDDGYIRVALREDKQKQKVDNNVRDNYEKIVKAANKLPPALLHTPAPKTVEKATKQEPVLVTEEVPATPTPTPTPTPAAKSVSKPKEPVVVTAEMIRKAELKAAVTRLRKFAGKMQKMADEATEMADLILSVEETMSIRLPAMLRDLDKALKANKT